VPIRENYYNTTQTDKESFVVIDSKGPFVTKTGLSNWRDRVFQAYSGLYLSSGELGFVS